jgi:hypothetical protein
MGEEPEEERKKEAQNEAGNDREIKGGVSTAMDDVAGEFSQAKGEFATEKKEGTGQNKEAAKKHESAAEFAKRIHKEIIEERPHGRASAKSVAARAGCSDTPLETNAEGTRDSHQGYHSPARATRRNGDR